MNTIQLLLKIAFMIVLKMINSTFVRHVHRRSLNYLRLLIRLTVWEKHTPLQKSLTKLMQNILQNYKINVLCKRNFVLKEFCHSQRKNIQLKPGFQYFQYYDSDSFLDEQNNLYSQSYNQWNKKCFHTCSIWSSKYNYKRETRNTELSCFIWDCPWSTNDNPGKKMTELSYTKWQFFQEMSRTCHVLVYDKSLKNWTNLAYLWWHISAITCRIITSMSTCQIFMLTCHLFIC